MAFTQSTTVINFAETKVITKIPAQIISISQLTINHCDDNPNTQTVILYTQELGPILLWGPTTSTTYLQIGNWTQADIKTQLINLYGS